MTPSEYADQKGRENEVAAFKPGIYRHWKGGLYRALFLAEDSTNREGPITTHAPGQLESSQEPIVIYISLTNGKPFVRSLAQWNELVPCRPDLERAVWEKMRPRFEWESP